MHCWASCLGNCATKQSGEHIVSKSVFAGNTVEVHGFKWCKEAPVRLAKSAVTANILCKKHNSDLSPLDDVGKAASDVFRECARITVVRTNLKRRRWNVKTYKIDGIQFERWCLKTLINFCVNSEHAIGRDGSVKGMPSERLVRIVYGHESFSAMAGLYWVSKVGMTITPEEKVQFMPIYRNNQNVEAGIFTFWGTTFLLYLEKEGPPKPFAGLYTNSDYIGDAEFAYHGKGMTYSLGPFRSHKIIFDWP